MPDRKKTAADPSEELTELRKQVKTLRKRAESAESAVTELRKAERQTIQQERLQALGEMSSGIVHDFNNAITPIMAASEFLIDNADTFENKEQTMALLKSIHTAANDARHMVGRVREFYRPEERAEVTEVDIDPIIKDVVMMTKPKWERIGADPGKVIKIDMDLGKPGKVWFNESYLRQVLVNIVFNAADAVDDGGTITVRSVSRDGKAVITISDTGIGMSEDVRQRCFEPFFTTKGRKGTGMGLATAYGVVRGYGGEIDIQSEVGKGTTVTIVVPEDGAKGSQS
jgi:signal transduction histidine kinase